MWSFKPKSAKEIVKRTIILTISSIIIFILVFSLALAAEDTETERGQELSSANNLAIILLAIIVIALIIYFTVELTANKKINKMFDRANKAAKNAFRLVDEFEKEERDKENKILLEKLGKERLEKERIQKEKRVPKKHKIRKLLSHPIKSSNHPEDNTILQKTLQSKRKNIHESKKEQILSEFEEQEQKLINQTSKYLKNKKKKKEDIFSKLNKIGK
jgi:hypothetical protein